MTTEDVIRRGVKAYNDGDADAVSTLLSNDICYTINAFDGPYRADCRSLDEFWQAVGAIQADWEVERYEMIDLVVNGERGAAQIAISMKSKHSGSVFDGRLALFFTVVDGLLTEIHEYHDTKMAGMARVE